jgi:5-methyltetrahydropteroyltriglutamate--homocysteine methyltransferase
MLQPRLFPPFRAEHLGSFPRPHGLLAAREAWAAGRLPREELRRIEDDAIRGVVAMQERAGIRVISDGEYRKSSWRDLLFDATDGFSGKTYSSDFTFTEFDGTTRRGMNVPQVTGRLRRREMLAPGYAFVRSLTRKAVKATLPAPSVNHFFRGDKMLAHSPYESDREAYFADVAAIYRQEIADLAAEGCAYLQIDDVPSAVLCDPRNQALVRDRGEDPQALIDQYFQLFNAAVRDRPKNMLLAVHLCRGNSGHGQASGGYEPVAERLFNAIDADAYFLEYDTERAGGFEPLRHLPKDRVAVLGILSTKVMALEPEDDVRRRIDAAARYVDLERLCLSPQCGFSSSALTARSTDAEQEKKLAHMVAIAEKVWGTA